MALTALTIIHVLISLVAIASGLIVFYGMCAGKYLRGWTALFLWMTVATSVTGFFFPITGLTPGLVLGMVSLPLLAVALYALYGRRLEDAWRNVYAITALIALYLNVFVLVVQSFQKIPPLKALAPTQTEPPFAIAQGVVLVLFVVFGIRAVVRFRRAVLEL